MPALGEKENKMKKGKKIQALSKKKKLKPSLLVFKSDTGP